MSYQVLARKWRPAGFDEVTGQAHVTTPLRNAIRTGRIPHAVLLCGPRGVGKTTLARILARCLNCEKGPTPEPCGTCTACVEIAEGRSTDVQEVDAASRTSVDDVREIIESIRYAAAPGKHRIYVVDEVHMLSTQAFNALLKTLEEPPPRSLFVFATTNPERVPFTVVSRCQRHDLRRIPTAEVAARLGEVARAEGVAISERSLREVARAGEGSLRDALTLLDQLVAVGGERIEDERVAEVLDLIDRRLLLAIAEACVEGDARAALEATRRAGDQGVDAKRLGGALLRTFRDLSVLRVAPQSGLVEGDDEEVAALRAVAERTEEARLRRMFRALLREQEDLAWAPDPFAVIEMAAIRLATTPAGDDVARLVQRIEQLERRLSGGDPAGGPPPAGGAAAKGEADTAPRSGGAARKGRGASAAAETERAQGAAPGADGAAPQPPSANAKPPAEAGAAPPPGPEGPGASAESEVAAGERASEPGRGSRIAGERPGTAGPESGSANGAAAGPTAPPGPDAPLPLVYDRLRVFAQATNRGLFAALDEGRLAECDGERLRIALPPGLAARRLEARRPDLEAVCERFFGGPVRVAIETEEPAAPAGGAPPRRAPRRADGDALRRRKKEALDHPAVSAAREILEGEILEIRPLDTGPTDAARAPGPGGEP